MGKLNSNEEVLAVEVKKVILLKTGEHRIERELALKGLYGQVEIIETNYIRSYRKLKKMVSEIQDLVMIEADALSDLVLAMAILNPGVTVSKQVDIRKSLKTPFLDEKLKPKYYFDGYGDPLCRVEFG